MQRTSHAAALSLLIQRSGEFAFSWVDFKNGVEPWALLIVGVNPVKVQADQSLVRERTGAHGILNVLDARAEQIQRARRRRRRSKR